MNLPSAFLGLAKSVSAAFGGPYHPGQIIRQVAAVTDDGGSIVTPGYADRAPCLVQIDAVDERSRPEGWTDKDYRFLILSASIKAGVPSGVVPVLDTDATVEVSTGPMAGKWAVSALQGDPAGIGKVGRGRQA